ncbi:hypothetical protein [Bradyrhizobium diversitatis]|uniref:Uncharacterized protein n=1 Tax=Bradyrhizobium diversitatis TaxID=2755406 RepID=A0ABS0PAV7_9BRAD|nr:hypothetical protein [Bradyrhizobium diversitatis]MBH5390445.1 hypothetical protein [Bradyrhizobium diversitatis]
MNNDLKRDDDSQSHRALVAGANVPVSPRGTTDVARAQLANEAICVRPASPAADFLLNFLPARASYS